jgi:transcriptional regulator CtsR
MPQSSRVPYRNLARNSPIRSYEFGPSLIRVWFEDGKGYEYDSRRPGGEHVNVMKRLAEDGRGLATYINKYVKTYARKL